MEDFHLLQQIGEGSFGRVYKARRKYTGRLTAIKMINKLGQSKDDLVSFKREIDILQKMDHPHIMRMLKIFETDTDFCVVSELARGDLFQIIDDNQTLPESILKNVAAQLISALSYLHKYRIIHRDMKPQNILIASNGSLKLCDFGFARALSSNTLALTSIKGTPLYMAPELVQEHQYDEKIDVWSLGIILYELYYGQPPFFTNSIYKLIQMIVNDPITWPGPISENFKSFLLLMLQKDPEQRVSCETLLKHPFIADVKLTAFDDHLYQKKSTQFEKAIKDSLTPGSGNYFRAPKSKIPDFQSILVNPRVRTAEELLAAVKHLIEINVGPDSPLAASFSFHFTEFISKPIVLEEALCLAVSLLQQDPGRFITPFSVGISLLSNPELPPVAVDFFTELLTIPFSQTLIELNDDLMDLQLTLESAAKLRDRLLSFLFSSHNLGQIFSFLSYLSQTSGPFLEQVSQSFAPQFVPILTSAIIHNNSPVVRTASLAILAKIIVENPNAVDFVQPRKPFCDVYSTFFESIDDVTTFCLFSAALSLNTVLPDEFTVIPSVDQDSLLYFASVRPETLDEILCYASILTSPFQHFSFTQIDKIQTLLEFHRPALLSSVFHLGESAVIPYTDIILATFESPACAKLVSDVIIEGSMTKLLGKMIDCGYLVVVSNMISEAGPAILPDVVYAWSKTILSFESPNKLLLEQAPVILSSIFTLDSAVETSLLIASHFARLSSDFIPILDDAGAVQLAESALCSPIQEIRQRSATFVGNYCRHSALPDPEKIINLLIDTLRETRSRAATFAVGNVLFRSPELGSWIACEIPLLLELYESGDKKITEDIAGIFGNLVRHSDEYLDILISEGVLDAMIPSLDDEEIGGRILLNLTLFCQYSKAIEYIEQIEGIKHIEKHLKSTNPRVARNARKILDAIIG